MSDEIEEQEELSLYPPWKEAIETFKRSGFTYGQTIPRTWFEDAFGMKPLDDETMLSFDQYRKRQTDWLNSFYPFREAILEQMQMDLQTNQRGGYTIVAPQDQAIKAFEDTQKAIKRAIQEGQSRIRHTNVAALSASERQRLADISAKAAMLAGMIRQRPRLLDPDD